jgi:hypothetical protein
MTNTPNSAAAVGPALLPSDRYPKFAQALGDTPLTAMDVHSILRGLCRVYVAGELPAFAAAVVQLDNNPRELDGYGPDAQELARLLAQVTGWDCVLVASELAGPLGAILEARTGRRPRTYGDVAYVAPASGLVPYAHPDVRLLTPSDLPLFDDAPDGMQGMGFGSPAALLQQGLAAGAVIDGALVALAHTSALSPRYGEIGVNCREPHRRRGYATAAAWLVGDRIRATGRTPIWSTGETNWASQRVATKLGFREIVRRVYVIPQRDSL